MEEFVMEQYKAGAFQTCMRQHWPVITRPPMKVPTPTATPHTYCRRPTMVPPKFREEVRAGLRADVRKGVLERAQVEDADRWCSRTVI